MTASIHVSNDLPISDLPRPDSASDSISSNSDAQIALPRALPKIADSGRISFGAGYRLPLSK
jgi:hypothetical protein